ncbi:MAG TPA: hypothetical protein VHM91_24525 [Verrucomicrobiales bacterium]|jgi:hypothetical protein|nr:hypothetical protein [Verrucomicrobiales bacterium]
MKILLLLLFPLLLGSCTGAGFPERKPGSKPTLDVTVEGSATKFH